MALTTEQQALLRTELHQSVYTGLTADRAFALLNNPQTVTTSQTVPVTMDVAALLGQLSAGSVKNLANWPHLTDLRDKIQSQDQQGVALWGQILVAAGLITQTEHDAVVATISQTTTRQIQTVEPPRVMTSFVGEAGFPNYIERADFDAVWGT